MRLLNLKLKKNLYQSQFLVLYHCEYELPDYLIFLYHFNDCKYEARAITSDSVNDLLGSI